MNSQTEPTLLHVDSKVLGQFLAAQTVVYVFEDPARLAEFAVKVLQDVPGIGGANICLARLSSPIGTLQSPPCRQCSIFAAELGKKPLQECKLTKQKNIKRLPLQTPNDQYGYVVFSVSDAREFALYESHLYNFTSFLSITIENRIQRQQLRSSNRSLLEQIEITKLAEETLNQAQHIAHIGNWVWDIKTGVLSWSDEIYRIFNQDPEKFTPSYQAFLSCIHQDDRRHVSEEINRTLKNFKKYSLDHRVIRPDGVICIVHEQGELELDPQGKPYRMIGTIQDITEQRLKQSELQKLKVELQNIIECMPSVVFVTDRHGLITYWNSRAEQLSKFPLSRSRENSLVENFPMLADKMDNILWAIEKQQPVFAERLILRGPEINKIFELIIYPLTGEGSGSAAIRIDDITEQSRIEEAMVSSEKMISLSGLAAGMAHEINNPLGGIVQGYQNVKRRFSPDIKNNVAVADALGLDLNAVNMYMEQRQIHYFIDAVSECVARAGSIVKDMISLSRTASAIKRPTDINELIEKALALLLIDYKLTTLYKIGDVEFIRDYDPELPAVDCLDSDIQQVIMNIIRNSVQAMEKRNPHHPATITLSTSFDEGVHIKIKDNGPGMDDNTKRRIFEPFFTTKPPGEGTGLGLAVSYFIIIDRHHGYISVESTPNEGTTFFIDLPIKDESPTTY
ncbi:ATP-binding protein [Pseudomonadota bacterium]